LRPRLCQAASKKPPDGRTVIAAAIRVRLGSGINLDTDISLPSRRPAGTAEHAPEILEVSGGHRTRPGPGMIMAVNITRMGAAASQSDRLAPRALSFRAGMIAAKGTDRRPVRHRGRQRRREF